MSYLSLNISYLRNKKKWSQEFLASKIGKTSSAISSYEKGKNDPSTTVLIKLAEVFEVPVDELLFLNIEEPEKTVRDPKMKKSARQPKYVTEVIDFVKKNGGLEYAIEAMKRYHRQAMDILNTFPDTPYRQSLEMLVQFTIERTK